MTVMATSDEADNAPMVLEDVLDLAAADRFHELMLQWVGERRPLRIDASAVKVLTLPCIQVLLAARASHGQIAIENPSPAFCAAFDDLGIEWDFGPREELQEFDELIVAPDDGQDGQSLDEGPDPVGEAEEQASDRDAEQVSAASADPQLAESIMGKRILTIDDSKTMRDMLMLTLAEAGFDVVQAVDGQDGLDVLAKEQVDVVITDINMPRMDGYEVIRRLRQRSDHKATPILVLTTESEAEKKNLAREAGATGWMVKPFDPDQLVATVRKVAP